QLKQPLQNHFHPAEGLRPQSAELSVWTEPADIGFADLIALDPAGLWQTCFASGNFDMNPQWRAGTRYWDHNQDTKGAFVQIIGRDHQGGVLVTNLVSDRWRKIHPPNFTAARALRRGRIRQLHRLPFIRSAEVPAYRSRSFRSCG